MEKITLQKIRREIVRWKVYAMRSQSYISFLNTGMILYLFLSGFIEGLDKQLPLLFCLSFVTFIALGYLEIKLGFYTTEHRENQSRNPYMKEILSELEDIKRLLNK